jgi:hypothetical protein
VAIAERVDDGSTGERGDWLCRVPRCRYYGRGVLASAARSHLSKMHKTAAKRCLLEGEMPARSKYKQVRKRLKACTVVQAARGASAMTAETRQAPVDPNALLDFPMFVTTGGLHQLQASVLPGNGQRVLAAGFTGRAPDSFQVRGLGDRGSVPCCQRRTLT